LEGRNLKDDTQKFIVTISILGFMGFLANGDNYAVAPLLINISKDLNITITQTGLSVTSYMLCFGIFTIFFGPLGDRFGKTRIINIAAFGTAIFSMLGALSYNLPSLIFFRSVNGAFGAGIFPVSIAFIGGCCTDKNRQKWIAKFFGMMFLGGASATAIGGAIAYFGSWRAVYFIYGFLELIVAFMMLKSLEKEPGVINKLDIVGVYRKAFANKELVKVICTIFLVGFSVFGTFTYSGQFITDHTGYNILTVGLILTVFGLGTVIGGRLAPRLRQKYNKKFVPAAAILGTVSLAILFFATTPLLLSIGLFGFGYAFISIHSTLTTIAQGLMPQLRGTVMSLVSFGLFGGGALGTFVNGIVIQNSEIKWTYAIGAILMAIVFFMTSKVVDVSIRKEEAGAFPA
jgi:predicted MFS family arabinose efflux permease